MTHLIDTSVWHKYARYSGVSTALNALDEVGAVFSTCPPIIAEYCFSARDTQEMRAMQDELAHLYQLDELALTGAVQSIQRALWNAGLLRAAGPTDTLIAAYALAGDQTLVTCDDDFVHVSRALRRARVKTRMQVLHIAESGTVTTHY